MTATRRWSRWILLALVLTAGFPLLAHGQVVRAGQHAAYGRIVVEWPAAVTARHTLEGKQLRLTFSKPVKTSCQPLVKRLPLYLSTCAVQGNSILLTLEKPVTVKPFGEGGLAGFDIYPARAWPEPEKKPEKKEEVATTIPAEKPDAPPPIAQEIPPPQQQQPKEEETAAEESVAPAALPVLSAPSMQAMDENTVLPLTVLQGAGTLSVIAPWPFDTGAVVFRRGNVLWLVFDRPAKVDFSQPRKTKIQSIQGIAQLEHPDATIIRITVKDERLQPGVWRKANQWQIDLRPQDIHVDVGLRLKPQPDALPTPALLLGMPGMGTPLSVIDPDVGDHLWLVPSAQPGVGLMRPHLLPTFDILASAQGMVLATLDDSLMLRRETEVTRIQSAAGLPVQAWPVSAATTIEGAAITEKALFPVLQWQKVSAGKFFSERQKLQDLIVSAPNKEKNAARLALARFLFAHGYTVEAEGVLLNIVVQEESMARQPSLRALQAAIHFLRRRYDKAADLFSSEEFKGHPEATLWLAATYAAMGKEEEAGALKKDAMAIPASYGGSLATALAVPLVEMLLRQGDKVTSARLLDDVSAMNLTRAQKARIQFLQALLFQLQEKEYRSENILQKLSRSPDQWTQSHASMALLERQLAKSEISRKDAIKRLEQLRFAWRGDRFELHLLRTLANLYLQEHDYRRALTLLRRASERFAGYPEEKALQELLKKTFVELYLDGKADTLPPVTALALFDEFRALTPADERGDRMIQTLSDRLVAVDLLDRAADLLTHQIRERLQGEDKARVGARLALIRLLDRNPKQALDALMLSDDGIMSEGLADQRRYLQARALTELGKDKKALALLRGDLGEQATQLRSEIYWQQQDFTKLAKALKRLVDVEPDAKALDERQAQRIINLGLALAQAQDGEGLLGLYRKYNSLMARTPYATAFALFGQNDGTTDVTDYNTIKKQLDGIRQFEDFLDTYRQKLKNGKLSAVN